MAPLLIDVGTRSMPMIAIIGVFIGMTLAMESLGSFAVPGLESHPGMHFNMQVVRQIGPVFAAVLVAGRVGCALAAELGGMRTTEQIDAMRTMGVDPIAAIVVPRVIACTIMTPVLAAICGIAAIASGWCVAVVGQDFSSIVSVANSAWFAHWWTPIMGLLKATAFGFAIGLFSCYNGYTCRKGAAGVRRAVAGAFVASFLAIVILNFFLGDFLDTFGNVVLAQR